MLLFTAIVIVLKSWSIWTSGLTKFFRDSILKRSTINSWECRELNFTKITKPTQAAVRRITILWWMEMLMVLLGSALVISRINNSLVLLAPLEEEPMNWQSVVTVKAPKEGSITLNELACSLHRPLSSIKLRIICIPIRIKRRIRTLSNKIISGAWIQEKLMTGLLLGNGNEMRALSIPRRVWKADTGLLVAEECQLIKVTFTARLSESMGDLQIIHR